MSYQVFARKYRPQNFDDVLGQNHVTQTLKNAIQQKRLAHAYLFVGPRGTGKTSTARILAKSLNCIHGPTINPCGVCDSCKEISQGLSLDVLEIDGASNNSVDQIRELRENVRFAPMRGTYKIYIIDEVHMLSPQAFNALLKTLEEPPAHVIFVFATTEPHKVLPTILSRCQRFDLRRIPAQIIAKHLSYIAKKEEVILTQEAAEAIAVAAEGGLRDAESMLDQLVAFCGNTIRESEVLEVFGLTSEHVVADLTRSILNQKAAEALSIAHQQAEAGKDLNKLLSDLLGFFRNLLVYKIDRPSLREEIGDQARSALDELAPVIDAQRLLRLIEKISEVESTIKWASNKKLHLEIALIRAIQTLSEVRLGAVIDALASLRGGADQPAGSESAPPLATPLPKKAPTAENPPRPSPEELPAAKPAAEASPAQDLPKSEIDSAVESSIESAWARLLQVVATRRPLILSWIELGSPIQLDNGTFQLGFPKDQELAVESLSRPNNRKLLEDVLSEILGGRWKIVFEMREDLSLPTATTTAEEPVDPLQSFKNDPMIQKALEIFKAEIQSDR
ncbi:MAG TPA: DNA polymerase III subunit gamma/tau [Chthoniobacterales bacterium]|nr:DNA polymerase III subunit gamma/tau [Chthoniobacterales bacterium]